ncbi:hypothetical protein B4966_04640 [Rhodocyclaceae bacterium]|nr:hypothetical protein B4966_04640 [Rhodocyclaceae bacterium]
MEWEFTAEDVVKARAAYRLEDFRRDLAEEVRMNMAGADPLQQAGAFDLIYDMCYALATHRELDEFLSAHAFDPPTCEFLREIRPAMDGNIEMLGAILQRMIMDGVEQGMAVEAAVAEAAARHAQVVGATRRSYPT